MTLQRRTFEERLADIRYTVFVKNMTKLLFSDDELLSSTVRGNPTRRNTSKGNVVEKPKKLDPEKVQVIEGKDFLY